MDRREFIISSLVGSSSLIFPTYFLRSAQKKLDILVLGGTNFVGPALVNEAMERGHNVTLFNRGKTDPNLFPNIELLVGNRFPNKGNGLTELNNKRTWDVVIDTWDEEPGCVNLTARLLKDRVQQYVYISSIAVYRQYSIIGITEEGPLPNAIDYSDSFQTDLSYPIRKRSSEQVIQKYFKNKSTILRCTTILGLDSGKKDPNNQEAAAYWGLRLLSNQPILIPNDDSALFQYIDVKDVATFCFNAIEKELSGPFNLVGPRKPLTLIGFLEVWKEVIESNSEFIKVDPSVLHNKYNIQPFQHLPFWIPLNVPQPGFYQISNKRALNNSLSFKPLQETLADIMPSLLGHNLNSISYGLDRTKEQMIIKEWQKSAKY